jgi:ATP-dependent exoDNAse (exonuclease V) beta subunit
MFAVEERLVEYEQWRATHHATVAGASKPSLRVATATAWARESRGEPERDRRDAVASAVKTVVVTVGGDRPFGPRFGTLVHATLATVPLDADSDTIEGIARTQARILGATEEERDGAVRAIADVLVHPLLQRARKSAEDGRCYREMPVTWMAPDGMLVEGTIDLAFEDADGITVLDFKTDRELATDLDHYRQQLAVYCRAMEQVRAVKVQGLLVRV